MPVESRFKFWPIGQGLFYTGSIDDGKFNFVYDCGSSAMVAGGKAALEKSTMEYLQELEDGWSESASGENIKYLNYKNINFMVVSHLDADHINGIFELLARTCIDRLYLPYLGDSRRNELLIKLVIANAIIDTDESGDTFEKKFRTLVEFYERNEEQDFIEQERRVWEIIQVGGKKSQEQEQYRIAAKTTWQFSMFSREISEESFNKWNDAIEKKLDGRTIEQLLLEWSISPDPVRAKQKNLAELKKIYKNIEHNINHTSIVLAHYPVSSDREECGVRIDCKNECRRYCDNCCEMKCCRRIRHNEPWKNPITVLTGDAEFDNMMKSTLTSILRDGHCRPFCILQVPHHGAKNEWESLKNSKGWRALQINEDVDVFVIPFGHGNTYGHPSYEIKNDLREMNRQDGVVWVEVTQFNEFKYRIHTART